MNNKTNLKAIERRAYLSYHQDGLVDIVAGGAILSLSIMIWLLPEFWFFLVGSLVVLGFLYTAVKKSITVPRMGYVEFSSDRRHKTQYIFLTFIVILVFANILGIIAMLFPPLGILIFESAYTILILGLIVGFLLAFIGFVSDIRRFYVYGLVFLVTAIFTFFVPILIILPLLVLSLIMIAYGAVLLYRFTQRFPKEPHGEVEGV